MTRLYTSTLFTPTVVAAQEAGGTRAVAERMVAAPGEDTQLSAAEADFIQARDSFYMASHSESGWPYLQHRGGPTGFVRVLDERTLGFADFRGNQQLISSGNLAHDGRVALFFMDYPGRRRLKLLARGRVQPAAQDPDLTRRLAVADYRARVERVFVFDVVAFDWNCPQHITPRFTLEQAARLLAEDGSPRSPDR